MKPLEELLEIAKCAKERADKVNSFRYSPCSHEDSYTRSSNNETKRPVTFCRDCDSCFTHHLPTDIPELSDAVIDLITQLKDAQAEIKNLKTFNTEFTRVDKISWGDLFNEITQLKQDIEKLKKRISWLESGSIHTCHAECEKPLCVANREIEKLQLENAELKKLLTHHNDYITFLETEIPKLDSIKKALKVATKALAEITDKTESRAEFTRNALNIVSRSALQKINTLTGGK